MKSSSLTLTFDYVTWKWKRDHPLEAALVPSLVNITQRIRRYEVDNTWDKAQQFDLDYVTWKINRDHILSLEGITVSSLVTFHHRGHKIFRVENTWEKQFNLRKWTGKLKMKREHLLLDGNYCTKFGSFQAKRSKDIEHSTFGIETSSLTLTFNHMAWKSIGVITSLGVISVLNMSNYKQKKRSLDIEWSIFIRRPAIWPLTTWHEKQ